jgi:hypothetical protein
VEWHESGDWPIDAAIKEAVKLCKPMPCSDKDDLIICPACQGDDDMECETCKGERWVNLDEYQKVGENNGN